MDIDRNNNKRFYYRIPNKPKIRIWKIPGQDGFYEAVAAAERGEQLPKPDTAPKRRAAGVLTLSKLCLSYFRSAGFQELTEITRQTRKGILLSCCAEETTKEGSGLLMGDVALHEFTKAHVIALRDRETKGRHGELAQPRGPESRNNRVKAIRGLFAWHLEGKDDGVNPCAGLRKIKSTNPDGFHAWTLKEVAAYEAQHAIGTTARLAFDLALYTSQRRSDVVKLGPPHVTMDDGIAWLRFRQGKTGAEVQIPIIEPLAESIAARPAAEAKVFLVTSFGKPFTANGIGNAFRAWCDEAGLKHCSMHGLRKATASRLAELGVAEGGIAAITGHAEGSKSLAIYTKSARRRLMAADAMRRLAESLPERERVLMLEDQRT